ncbi:MAG: TRAP transporter large permease subunit [Kiritimatiellae bacterium]|nr:TRAP transporter large permease subunit [Kiritimatiellia bacterium]
MIPALLLAALVGAPMFAVFAALAWTLYSRDGIAPALIVAEMNRLATMPLLRALPLFALAGYLLAESRAPERLLRLSRAAFGWLPGGLPAVAILACTLFTAFTGASGVTIVALGGLLLPALLREGYREPYALGLLTSGGNCGVLLVPSLPLILYGIIANPIAPAVTIERLIRAALLPAALGVLALVAHGAWAARRQRIARTPFSWRELGAALWAARWEAPLPALVLVGIYSGRLVISDAAAVAAAYAIIVEVAILREVRWRDFGRIARDALVLVGGVLVILGMGMALTNWLVDQEVPQQLLEAVRAHVGSPAMFLLVVNAFLLAVGCAMDIYTAIVVIAPLLVPLGAAYDVDPVHLGIIVLANLAIGYSTPPVGMNLFIAALRFRRPLLSLARASLPMIVVLLAVLALITFVPGLSLWLAN